MQGLNGGHKSRLRRGRPGAIPPWSIPLAYAVVALVLGGALPRVERLWFPDLITPMSVSVAIAIDSSVASGMIALTGIVFALAFVMVQFGAVAYSPRLVPWIARDPLLMHSVGVFTATFLYALAALAWVDRQGSGSVPFVSGAAVVLFLLVSVGMFVGLVQRLRRLQVQSILTFAAARGREVIDELYPPLETSPAMMAAGEFDRLPITQVLTYSGPPKAIQALDVQALFDAARDSRGVMEVVSAVGDTVGEGVILLRVHRGESLLDERRLRKAFILGDERTFEQDPKYAIHLLVDIAIRALSPAVNDPSTAVQALDQIEDLLVRLGRRRLEVGALRDADGEVRLAVPFPVWEDFLTLSLEEIRHFGASSKQVMRRMGALLSDLLEALPPERRGALRREQERLKAVVTRSFTDDEEVTLARVEDRQGIGSPCRYARTHDPEAGQAHLGA